jgi:hypothetical protein
MRQLLASFAKRFKFASQQDIERNVDRLVRGGHVDNCNGQFALMTKPRVLQ